METVINRNTDEMCEFNDIDFSEPEPESLSGMGEKLFLLKQSEKHAKENYEEIKADRMQVEETLCAQLEASGIESFKTNRGTFYIKTNIYASILVKNRPTMFEWLRENDFGSLIQETVDARTLSSTVKGLLEDGETVPEEVNVTVKKSVGMRKK